MEAGSHFVWIEVDCESLADGPVVLGARMRIVTSRGLWRYGRVIGVSLFAGLAACAPTQDGSALRVPSDPIYSNASFDQMRLAGSWKQVATFAAKPGCSAGRATFAKGPAGTLTGQAQLCVAGRDQIWSGAVTPAGPGRFTIGDGEAWWVLWDDADNRTLVIGTPSGAFGFILDRNAPIPGDRLMAAREILDFNGYDLATLKTF